MRIIALVLLLCTLTACSMAPNRYLSVSLHDDSSNRVTDSNAVVVSDYAGLKAAILELVKAGQTRGSIRAVNYRGDLESDLADAAYEVSKNEPLGAYAVDYMTHDCTLIVNYYEIDIRTTFRRTAREIDSIEPLFSPTQLQNRLEEAVDELETRVTVELRNYREMDIAEWVESYCAERPGTVMETPQVSVSVYPNSGTTRILEIDLGYSEPVETLAKKQQAVQESVDAAAEYIRYRQSDREKVELLYTYMTERFTYTQQPTTTPVHDALCAGVADPTGLAHAFRLVCNRAGMVCTTVTGLRNGQEHIWNIVSLDGEYRHVDLSADILDAGTLRFRTDNEMTDYYWNQAQYPACVALVNPQQETQTPAEEAPPAELPAEEEVPVQPEEEPLEEQPTVEEEVLPAEGEPEPASTEEIPAA